MRTQTEQMDLLRTCDLDLLLDQAAEYAAAKKTAEAEEGKRRAVILEKMTGLGLSVGQAYVNGAGIGATIQTKTTSTINVPRLVLAGVDQDVIDRATDVSVSKPFVTVRVPKVKAPA